MEISECSILHHVGLVLFLLWLLSHYNCCHPILYLVFLIYLYLVHDWYVMRLRKKLQFEERKQSHQRRVLTDSETSRWLNHVLEKIWPICIDHVASQKILRPIIPWFLEKYKPWTTEKLLSIAFEQTLVEPNMLVVDMEKFVSPNEESWFSVNDKDPLGYVRVEVIEASNIKAADLNGLSDPYVVQKKTLAPKWHEEFKTPIVTWDSARVLSIEVHDKGRFADDFLGLCSINIGDYRDSQRHDIWLPLQNLKTGRLHLALTVLEVSTKADVDQNVQETLNVEAERKTLVNDASTRSSISSASSKKYEKVADSFEPIDVDGQRETGIWVHHPGSKVSPTWESRKGRTRILENEIRNQQVAIFQSHQPPREMMSRVALKRITMI